MARESHNSKTGLILGKFLPPHAGHQYLVEFGLHFVDRLHVLVCSIPSESIPGALRYNWMKEMFPAAHVKHLERELPQEPREHPQFWDLWRAAIKEMVPESIDFVFASEEYGYRLALELTATYIPVDPDRSRFPISGTEVRHHPLKYWSFLPERVRPYFVQRICLFGPESTGKSTLARQLAEHYETLYVPEFARHWLEPKQGICELSDIPLIARGQLAAEDALAPHANRLLFCDTDLWLTTLWSHVLFDQCPDWIVQAAAQRSYDLYLLLDVDVPWVDDEQRYLPHRRQEFFDRCRQLLDDKQLAYCTIDGDWSQRFNTARQRIDELMEKNGQRKNVLRGKRE